MVTSSFRIFRIGLCVAIAALAWADNGKGKANSNGNSDEHRQDDPTVWQAGLVRASELDFQVTTGTDPLKKGKVEVTAEGNVEVSLSGAASNAGYVGNFCRFALTAVGCMTLVNGAFNTDPDGDAKAEMRMPLTPATWSGIFLIARGGVVQFVTAFSTRGPNAPAGADIEVKGRVSFVDPGARTFRLEGFPVPIFVTSGTNLVKLDSLQQLRPGDRVEVRGFAVNGGVEASRVKADD